MGFRTDVRQAARALTRVPGYAGVAVVTLALGIGASVAIYTVLEHVVLEPMPYPEPDRLVRVKSPVPGSGTDDEWETSTAEYFYFREHATTVDAVEMFYGGTGTLQTPDGPVRVHVGRVTAGMLPLLGAVASAGRLPSEADDRPDAPAIAVLSHGFWQRQFGGARDVIGRTITVNERPLEIVGVMSPGTELPPERGQPFSAATDLWTAMQIDPAGPFYNSHVTQRMLLRLKPGVAPERAQTEFASLVTRLPDAYPTAYSTGFLEKYGFTARLYPLKQYVVGDVASSLWILFAAVGIVLLIALANAANLFLVRTETRRQEIAVRSALGAGRAAIARHFLAESAVLSGFGGAAGLLVGYWGLKWLLALAPARLPRLDEVRFDGSVFGFAAALALLVALTLVLFPLLHVSRIHGVAALAEGGRVGTSRERRRLRSTLVAAQMALALVLLVAASLLFQSFRSLRAVDPGIEPAGVITAALNPSPNRYRTATDVWNFYRDVLARIQAIPAVTVAGLSQATPLGGSGCTVQGFEDASVYERVSASQNTTCAGQEPTTPGYFETLNIPVLRGRAFTSADNDRPEAGAVVVSTAFADRFWPGEDPIGKGVAPNGRSRGPFYHVIGVVGDVDAEALGGDAAIAIYYPIVHIPNSGGWWPYTMNLYVKTSLEQPLTLLPALRNAVREIDATVLLSDVQEMQAVVDRSMSRVSFMMVLLGIAGAVALLLAAIGLYGVISYNVTRRRSEIGVRLALGARPPQVLRMVIGESIRLASFGLAAGLIVAFFASRLLSGLLYEVAPTNAVAYVTSATVLGVVALLASWLPARRAARVQPADLVRMT